MKFRRYGYRLFVFFNEFLGWEFVVVFFRAVIVEDVDEIVVVF